jgi:hypothetical protein
MITIEVIQNPLLPIITVLVLLCSVTALMFIAIILACGLRAEDILEAES